MANIGSIIRKVINEQKMSIAQFAKEIHRARRSCYNIFDRNTIDIELLADISKALNHNFFMDLAKDYNLAKPVEVDDYTRNAVGQFMTVMPELMNDLKFNGNIVTCSEVNFDEDIDIPTPDYIIDPCFFLVTIGESFENRCKRYECAEAFKFIPIDDSNGASVILCDNLVYNRQSVNIILDYKTKEEWRDTLELAFVTADKYYTDATKFSIKSAIGY